MGCIALLQYDFYWALGFFKGVFNFSLFGFNRKGTNLAVIWPPDVR